MYECDGQAVHKPLAIECIYGRYCKIMKEYMVKFYLIACVCVCV